MTLGRAAWRPESSWDEVFAADVREGLLATPRHLPSRYFYDDLGSALFEAICRLPWYRITRSELALLARHARDVLSPLGPPASLVELGCGSGEKMAVLASGTGRPSTQIQLVDVSRAALDMASHRLHSAGHTAVLTHQCPYEEGLVRAARHRPREGTLAVVFLGSNLGNFDRPAARALLRRIRDALRPGDALVLGTDLVKPEAELLLAYDDPLGVTAAFNLNLLRRIDDELGGTFVLDGFAHRATWNAEEHRVEMHLVSRREQRVRVPAAGLDLVMGEGESIRTETSYKYEPDTILAEGTRAGFARGTQWIDPEARFALTRFDVE